MSVLLIRRFVTGFSLLIFMVAQSQDRTYAEDAVVTGTEGDSGANSMWSRFRGPNGSGAVDGVELPRKWEDKDIIWSASLPGIGHSSPVAWGSQLFVQSADADHEHQFLICLSRDDGRELWRKSFPGAKYPIHTRNSFATSSPGVDEQHVYMAWSTAKETTLVALTHTGDEVWRRNLGPYVSSHGFAGSPVPVGDVVLIASLQSDEPDPEIEDGSIGTSFIAAFDSDTGEEKWRTARKCGKASYSTPAIYRPRNGEPQVVCCDTRDGMFGLALNDGRPLWAINVFDKRTVSSPLIAGDMILGSTGSGGGGNYLVAVDVTQAPREAYRVTNSAPYVPTSVVKDNLLFMWSDAGIVTCADLATGQERWRKRIGGNFSASPVRVGNQLLGVNDNGDVTILAAASEYELLGSNSLGGPTRATPAITSEAAYFRTEQKILAVRVIPTH